LRSSELKVAELQEANAIDSKAIRAARAPRPHDPRGPEFSTYANSSANLLYWVSVGLDPVDRQAFASQFLALQYDTPTRKPSSESAVYDKVCECCRTDIPRCNTDLVRRWIPDRDFAQASYIAWSSHLSADLNRKPRIAAPARKDPRLLETVCAPGIMFFWRPYYCQIFKGTCCGLVSKPPPSRRPFF
jgi:hypothetical protein